MAFIVDEETGDITLVQGDSGEYIVSDLPTDKNYSLYFAIQDENRNPVGPEINVEANGSSTVTFSIVPSLTDLLTVIRGEETQDYYFGIKICYAADNFEDTLLLGNKNLGDLNIITVYPKKVEGI